MGRFINADDVSNLGVNSDFASENLFVYCGNNPVGRADNCGKWWHLLVGAAVGLATQYISDVVTNLASGKSFTESLKPTSTWADYGAAAVSGALAASGIGLGGSIVANAAISGVTYLADCDIKGEEVNEKDFWLATGAGAISGLVGGKGADGSKLRGITKTSKDILKTAVSPKKIAMYTEKIAMSRNVAIVSGLRTVTAGLTSNLLGYYRKGCTGSEA